MNNFISTFIKKHFTTGLDSLPEREKRVAHRFSERKTISRNTNREYDETLTLGQRMADKMAAVGGSWPFLIVFGLTLLGWVTLNSVVLARLGKPFDPYPYILLNLVLSMLASIQAPVILMSQSRQARKDRLDAEHDYEVNLKSELEILSLHEKLDELRDTKWGELIRMQQEQIELLTKLLREREGERS